MADNTPTNTVLSVCATVSSKLKDLAIQNGTLIFIKDKHRIAFDFNNKRQFYNQIEELSSEAERITLSEPINGGYYFVIDSAVLWTYQNDNWIQLTSIPESVIFIGTEIPELGSAKTLYVDKTNKNIAVWDEITNNYIVVADKKETTTLSDIDLLFN